MADDGTREPTSQTNSIRELGPTYSLALRMLATIAILVVVGCAGEAPRNPVPISLIDEATPVGFEQIRFWGDRNDPEMIERMMAERARDIRERFADTVDKHGAPELSYLAISGGGQYGAFTAGILTGWSEMGTRPRFEGVTGISTGSIIAPFAFLGPEYDPVLREIYTTLSTEDVATSTVFSGLLSGSALADTAPLRAQIAKHVTSEFLARIADEYRKGRLLIVGTTNLDVGRPVLWDMGAIAAAGGPKALRLFQNVILASAAIPIAFPPVRFEVEAGGQRFEELHVDGGVTSQVKLLSPQLPGFMMEDLVGFELDRELYVVLNGAVTPLPNTVEPRVLAIGSASMDALWYAQAVGDLYKILALAERDGVSVRFGWIPDNFIDSPDEQFDPIFMKKLFELGQDLVSTGELWQVYPPDYAAPEAAG